MNQGVKIDNVLKTPQCLSFNISITNSALYRRPFSQGPLINNDGKRRWRRRNDRKKREEEKCGTHNEF